MDYVNMIKKRVIVSSILFIFALPLLCGHVLAESHTIKAPRTYYVINLKDDERSYTLLDKLVLTTEGWACSAEYANQTIREIREINRYIQFFAEIEHSLQNLEKALVQMGHDKTITLSKANVHSYVNRTIRDAIKKRDFSSEEAVLERVKHMVKDTVEKEKDINQMFGKKRDLDLFKHVNSGTPGGIWKLSYIEPAELAWVEFIAQNCYQKQDLEAMANAIVSAARKLEEITKSYVDTRDKVLALDK